MATTAGSAALVWLHLPHINLVHGTLPPRWGALGERRVLEDAIPVIILEQRPAHSHSSTSSVLQQHPAPGVLGALAYT